MSSESIFVQAPADTRAEGRSTGEKGIKILDAEDPSAYAFGHSQGSQTGTLVPLASREGGIEGSRNPYGKIVAGVEVRKVKGRLTELPFAPNWLGSLLKGGQSMPRKTVEMPAPPAEDEDELTPAQRRAIQKADAKVTRDRAARKDAFQISVERQREAEEELKRIQDEMDADVVTGTPVPERFLGDDDDVSAEIEKVARHRPGKAAAPAMDVQAMFQMFQMMQAQAPVLRPVEVDTVPAPRQKVAGERVTMTGGFGTYRGNYMHVIETPDLVVLVYDLDSQVFTPPSCATPFQISCKDRSFSVYFAGIEFDLAFANCGIQVMIRTK